jgi:hypothetical protein
MSKIGKFMKREGDFSEVLPSGFSGIFQIHYFANFLPDNNIC